jgi:hypothetical protein
MQNNKLVFNLIISILTFLSLFFIVSVRSSLAIKCTVTGLTFGTRECIYNQAKVDENYERLRDRRNNSTTESYKKIKPCSKVVNISLKNKKYLEETGVQTSITCTQTKSNPKK